MFSSGLPAPRISLAHTPLSKHADAGLNLTDTSFINKFPPLLTSTPIASPTKPLFGPSTSTSTDSGKFSLQGDKSDVDVPKKTETVTTPIVLNQTPGTTNFMFKSPATPQASQITLTKPQTSGVSSSLFSNLASTPQAGQVAAAKTQNSEQQTSLFAKAPGTQPNQLFSFKPSTAPQTNPAPSIKPQNSEQQTSLFSNATGAQQSQPFSFKPQNQDQPFSIFAKATGAQQSQPFSFKPAADGKPSLFSSTTATSTPSSVSTPGSGFSSFSNITTALPNLSTSNEKPTFSFKPTVPSVQPEATENRKEEVSKASESSKVDHSQQFSSLPNAAKWILLMDKLQHQYKTKVSHFVNDEKRKDLRKKIRIGSNDFIDRNLQLYESDDEMTTVFGNFMLNLRKIVEGKAVEDLEESFVIDVKDEGEKIYFMECLTKRILGMVKIDQLLIPNAVLLHGIICKELEGFAEYFRSYIVTHNYIMQLTVDML